MIREADAWLDKRWEAADDKWLLEVIGVYEAHEMVRPRLLDRLLASDDHRVRAYATRVAGKWGTRLVKPLARLMQRAGDEHPRTSGWRRQWPQRMCPGQSRSRSLCRFGGERIVFSITPLARALGRCSRIGITPCATVSWILPDTPSARIFAKAARHAAEKGVGGGATLQHGLYGLSSTGGKGLSGVYPPLAGSEWVSGDPERLVKVILHGLTGPITVAGQKYGTGNAVPMPAMGGLSDHQIAAVLSYIRKEFGQEAAEVSAEAVKDPRRDGWLGQTLDGG